MSHDIEILSRSYEKICSSCNIGGGGYSNGKFAYKMFVTSKARRFVQGDKIKRFNPSFQVICRIETNA